MGSFGPIWGDKEDASPFFNFPYHFKQAGCPCFANSDASGWGVTVDHLFKDIGISAFANASYKVCLFCIGTQKGWDDEHASMPERDDRGIGAINRLMEIFDTRNVYMARFNNQSHDPIGKKSKQPVFE